MNFKEEYQNRIRSIENILKKYLPCQEGYQKIIMEAMEYSLMAGGKRLRPMLMKESYALFGGEGEIIEPFMAAIEMIHTYSLVHDDLPAMDNDEYRRGRKTTHVVYGEDMGILAGDALLNYAFETACRAFDIAPEESGRIGQALKILAGKAGIYGMIGGQVVDVKESRGTKFVLVQSSLNGFCRPSLAQMVAAYHPGPDAKGWEPLFTKADAFQFLLLTGETACEKVNLAGNLCTGVDVMATGITLPKAKVGDLLAVTKAGSYAYVITPTQFSSQPGPGQYLLTADGRMVDC